MARPAMSAKTTAKHLTRSEKDTKLTAEEKLRGASDRLRPPKYLTPAQKKIFRFIVGELEASGILGNLDVYVLTECSVALDRMQEVEQKINSNISDLYDKDITAVKERYTKIFFRCCNELCLSPQSRAKMGNLSIQAKDENPLLALLKEDE